MIIWRSRRLPARVQHAGVLEEEAGATHLHRLHSSLGYQSPAAYESSRPDRHTQSVRQTGASSIQDVEIITFDELYQRAGFIVADR